MEFQDRLKCVFKENDVEIIEFNGEKKFIKYRCKKCGTIYQNNNAISLLSKISLCERCWKPFSRWNKDRLQIYKLDRLFPDSDLTFLEFNGAKKSGKIKCNKCGYIKKYSSLPAVLRRTSTFFCENCEGIKNKTYEYLKNNLPDDIALLKWNGAAEKSEFQCRKCGAVFSRRIRLDSKLNYCPKCHTNNNKFTLLEAQENFERKYGKDYIILQYNGQRQRSLLKHICGFCFTTVLDSFGKTKGCPKCFKSYSKLEQKIEKFLLDNDYKYERQRRFDDFKKFPFDFCVYLKDKQILIEAQGRQHYQDVPIFDSYEKQHERD